MKIPDHFNTPKFRETLVEFTKMRKKIKKPMTNHAMHLMLLKLQRLADNVGLAVKILEQSIENSWQGIFPLHEGEKEIKRPVDRTGLEDAPTYSKEEYEKKWEEFWKELNEAKKEADKKAEEEDDVEIPF